ncbi:hypothetical protein B0T11DRAFT_273402 [Plectosphaerella cucumerina]|uniref:Uncharacterized protein n=1 Tax=Plectosphaerella cucumerina TaxID=40658 RepID=A0A8K0TVB8_9PEZI|nr:hypothetical protein B0T11DRAFT_273402 [Plectosphaerella cucumerina]
MCPLFSLASPPRTPPHDWSGPTNNPVRPHFDLDKTVRGFDRHHHNQTASHLSSHPPVNHQSHSRVPCPSSGGTPFANPGPHLFSRRQRTNPSPSNARSVTSGGGCIIITLRLLGESEVPKQPQPILLRILRLPALAVQLQPVSKQRRNIGRSLALSSCLPENSNYSRNQGSSLKAQRHALPLLHAAPPMPYRLSHAMGPPPKITFFKSPPLRLSHRAARTSICRARTGTGTHGAVNRSRRPASLRLPLRRLSVSTSRILRPVQGRKAARATLCHPRRCVALPSIPV